VSWLLLVPFHFIKFWITVIYVYVISIWNVKFPINNECSETINEYRIFKSNPSVFRLKYVVASGLIWYTYIYLSYRNVKYISSSLQYVQIIQFTSSMLIETFPFHNASRSLSILDGSQHILSQYNDASVVLLMNPNSIICPLSINHCHLYITTAIVWLI